VGKVKPGLMEKATGGGITYAGGGKPEGGKTWGNEQWLNSPCIIMFRCGIYESVLAYLVCWAEAGKLQGGGWG